MKSIFAILLVTIVTTPVLETSQQPKILVYEVSEKDGEDPEIQLLKIEDINVPDEDADYQDQTLSRYLQKYKNKNKYRQTSNRQSEIAQYEFEKYKDSNRPKLHKHSNHFTSYKNMNSNYRNNKLKDIRNRDLENIFIDWDKQRNIKDAQYHDYIKQNFQQNVKQYGRNSQKKKKDSFDDDYVDIGNGDVRKAPDDVLLSQLLKPLKRHKREVERSNIIQRLKQLLQRLQQLDNEDEAKITGQLYISHQGDENNWNLESSNDFVDSNYKKQAIHINRSPALRSGDAAADEEAENLDVGDPLFGDDRTMPPPKNTKYDNDY